jgi:hypothetical protein
VRLTTSMEHGSNVVGITPAVALVYGAGLEKPLIVWHYFLVTRGMDSLYQVLVGNLDTELFGAVADSGRQVLTLRTQYKHMGCNSPTVVLDICQRAPMQSRGASSSPATMIAVAMGTVFSQDSIEPGPASREGWQSHMRWINVDNPLALRRSSSRANTGQRAKLLGLPPHFRGSGPNPPLVPKDLGWTKRVSSTVHRSQAPWTPSRGSRWGSRGNRDRAGGGLTGPQAPAPPAPDLLPWWHQKLQRGEWAPEKPAPQHHGMGFSAAYRQGCGGDYRHRATDYDSRVPRAHNNNACRGSGMKPWPRPDGHGEGQVRAVSWAGGGKLPPPSGGVNW